MKIAYVTIYDASDVHNWSGTGYFLSKALINQGAELVYIGPLKTKNEFFHRIKRKFLEKIVKKNYLPDREPSVAMGYAKQIEAQLKIIKPDLIFSPGATAVGYLNTSIPVIIYTDATLRPMVGYYKKFSNLWKGSYRNAEKLEAQAIKNASLLIYSSDWAANSAIELYNATPDKVKVIPFGTNIESAYNENIVHQFIKTRGTKTCRLIFMGVDWERKGGDIAFKIAKKLFDQRFPVELHIVGIQDLPAECLQPFVFNHGFISKKTNEGKEELDKLLRICHFLVLPTLAECFGMVFSEANSYGIPCITTNTGGIPTVIKDGINGKKFPLDSSIDQYASYISDTFNNQALYEQLALNSYREFATRLNWDVAGKQMISYFHHLIEIKEKSI